MVIFGDFPYSALFGLAGYVMTTGVFCGVRPVCAPENVYTKQRRSYRGKVLEKKTALKIGEEFLQGNLIPLDVYIYIYTVYIAYMAYIYEQRYIIDSRYT